jgi:hypothetical protein
MVLKLPSKGINNSATDLNKYKQGNEHLEMSIIVILSGN